jgi:hypothetical protein
MQQMTAQKVDLNSPLPRMMCDSSANGLRSNMIPKPPKEMLDSIKMACLLRDLVDNEAEKLEPRGGGCCPAAWVDSVARGIRCPRPDSNYNMRRTGQQQEQASYMNSPGDAIPIKRDTANSNSKLFAQRRESARIPTLPPRCKKCVFSFHRCFSS